MEKIPEEVKTVSNTGESIEYKQPVWKIWKHKRYIVAIMSFMGFMNVYSLRTNLSVAIVDMTTLKNVTLENGTTVLQKEFDWDSTIQGYILSSFFYGYIFTQLVGGYLAVKIGGSRVFGFGIAATAIFTLLTPWIAKTNVYFFIAVRIVEGAFEGVTYPAIQEVWSNWAPPSEKSRLMSLSVSGSYFGAVVAMPICSLLATASGWETIFYVFGVLGLIWYITWTILVKDSPSKDSRINQQELIYIRDCIDAVKRDEKSDIPWLKIVTSTSVFSTAICLSCETWGFYTLLTYLPQMMKSLLGFDLNKAGFLSALPYLAMCITVQVSGHLADFLMGKGYLGTTCLRKLFVIVGFLGQATFIFTAGYWISQIGTPFCLILAVGLGGTAISALTTNPIDLAPKFASVIMGISNTAATLPGIVSPILTGYIVTDPTSVSQWRIVFYIASGIYFFGAIVSLLFTSGLKQPWAEPEQKLFNGVKEYNGKDNKNLQLEKSRQVD